MNTVKAMNNVAIETDGRLLSILDGSGKALATAVLDTKQRHRLIELLQDEDWPATKEIQTPEIKEVCAALRQANPEKEP